MYESYRKSYIQTNKQIFIYKYKKHMIYRINSIDGGLLNNQV